MNLSIVFGTYNRFSLLKDCVESCRQSVGDLSYEFVIADGGSTDGSREWLATQNDVVLLGEWRLEGAIQAFNKAFSLASGWAVVNINDDIIIIGDCLKQAYDYLQQHQNEVAQAAFMFDTAFNGQFRRGDVVHGRQAANFGMSQRLIGDYVGWWGNTYHTYGGDTECSIKYWEIGWKVVSLDQCKVHHAQIHDELRRDNDAAGHFWDIWTADRVAQFPKTPLSRKAMEEELARKGIKRLW
jgi:GT2 family glycosyltransferase